MRFLLLFLMAAGTAGCLGASTAGRDGPGDDASSTDGFDEDAPSADSVAGAAYRALVRARVEAATTSPVWQGVAIVRSNVLAHESRDHDADFYFRRAGITYDQISGLIRDMQAFLSSLTTTLYNNPLTWDIPIHDELVQLLTDLQHVPKSA